jgi:hypothetical protein
MATNGQGRELIRGALVGAGDAAVGWWFTRHLLTRSRRFEYRDKVVLITGGSRGLGLVLARQLVAEGARVAICSRESGNWSGRSNSWEPLFRLTSLTFASRRACANGSMPSISVQAELTS